VAGVLAAEAGQPPGRVEEPLERGPVGLGSLLHVELEELDRALEERVVERLLAAEVVIDRTDGDVGVLGDLVDPRVLEPALEEVPLGGLQDRCLRAGLTPL
jgi:hypothetical protein